MVLFILLYKKKYLQNIPLHLNVYIYIYIYSIYNYFLDYQNQFFFFFLKLHTSVLYIFEQQQNSVIESIYKDLLEDPPWNSMDLIEQTCCYYL